MSSGLRPSLGPVGENLQDNLQNNYTWQDWDWPIWHPLHWAQPDKGHCRGAPAELPFVDWHPLVGWHRPSNHEPIKLPNFKSNKYWARPSDGKRKGAIGRLKDALTGEGADVFVVLNGDKRTLHRDLPHRPQWSRWQGAGWDENFGHPDRDGTVGEGVHWNARWADRKGMRYNFYTRKYEGAEERMKNHKRDMLWTDARWAEGARRGDMEPECVRTGPGVYATRIPEWAGRFAGGRPHGF